MTAALALLADLRSRGIELETDGARAGLEHARAVGELLLEAKGRFPHGGWLPWLRTTPHWAQWPPAAPAPGPRGSSRAEGPAPLAVTVIVPET
jgi:hypothetical protein